MQQLQDFFNIQFENGSFQRLLWMQDTAPVYRHLTVRERLPEVFDNCVVASQLEFEWPVRSPDLTPCDVFVELHETFLSLYRERWKT